MSRTEVQVAAENVITRADAWLTTYQEPTSVIAVAEGRIRLAAAVNFWRDAVRRQDVRDAEVYLRNTPTVVEREAAAAAMISRPGWRQMVYDTLAWETKWGRGSSDRWLELTFRNNTRHGPVSLRPLPGEPSHQTISSARKSLVDAGLVWARGVEVVKGRKHTLWWTR